MQGFGHSEHTKADIAGIAGFSTSVIIDVFKWGERVVFFESKIGIMNIHQIPTSHYDHMQIGIGIRALVPKNRIHM
jgi:hypothetical protein